MAEPDAIEVALAAATAEKAQLAGELSSREAAEARAVESASALREKLVARRNALETERGQVEERVTALERRQNVALDLRKRLRKARNVLLRLPLGAAAVLGWLMLATTGADGWTAVALLPVEGVAVWWLADWADHLEMRDD